MSLTFSDSVKFFHGFFVQCRWKKGVHLGALVIGIKHAFRLSDVLASVSTVFQLFLQQLCDVLVRAESKSVWYFTDSVYNYANFSAEKQPCAILQYLGLVIN